MLSQRLEAVAAFVPSGTHALADIGCDHAYLPIELIKRGLVDVAIGCDINEGPLTAARKNAAASGIGSERLELRQGDGLAALSPGEVEMVTLAGMGSGLMAEILSASPQVVAGLRRIVAAPNVAPWLLRSWAAANGFAVVKEDIVFEHERFYEVLALEPSAESMCYSDFSLYFGIHLPERKDTMVDAYFARRKEHDARLLDVWKQLQVQHSDIIERYAKLDGLWREWEVRETCR